MARTFTRPTRYKKLAQNWGYSLKDLSANLDLSPQDLADKFAQRARDWGFVGNKTDTFYIVARRRAGEAPMSLTYCHRGTDEEREKFVGFINDTARCAKYSPLKSLVDINTVDAFLDNEIAEGSENSGTFKAFLKAREWAVAGASPDKKKKEEEEEVLELKTEKIEDDIPKHFPTEREVRTSGYHYLLAIAATWKDVQSELEDLREESRSLKSNIEKVPNVDTKVMIESLTKKDMEIFELRMKLKVANESLDKARVEFAKINAKNHPVLLTNTIDREREREREIVIKKADKRIPPHIIQMTVKKLLRVVPEVAILYSEKYPPKEMGANGIDQRIGFELRSYAMLKNNLTKWDKVPDDDTGHEVNLYPIDFLNGFTKYKLQLDILP